jgi:hypothetical protein
MFAVGGKLSCLTTRRKTLINSSALLLAALKVSCEALIERMMLSRTCFPEYVRRGNVAGSS